MNNDNANNNKANLPAGTNAKPTRNKALLPIFLVVAVDVLGLTFVLPLLPFVSFWQDQSLVSFRIVTEDVAS